MKAMNAKTAILIAALAVFAAAARPAAAAIYTFVDANGTIHFSNIPNDPRYKPHLPPRGKTGVATASGHVFIPRRSPDWQPDEESYESLIRRACRRYRVDPALVKAVIRAESNFDYLAVSPKGALGLMQIMPTTALELDIDDPFDPADNIDGGTRYLKQMLKRFKGNLELALAAYNAGPSLVSRLGRIPRLRETRNYVRRVLAHYRRYLAESSPYKRWANIRTSRRKRKS